MKSFLIIGMGKFGHHLVENLLNLGNSDIMVVDSQEERVSDLIYKVTSVQIGDCADPEVIKSLGVKNFDMVIVCIGTNFQSSLEVTSLVKEMGARYVVSKANRDVHARFLLRNGADEVIYPDRDIAEKLARAYSADNIFDYMELDDGYSIYEISIPKEWLGKSLMELDLRRKHEINVIGLKKGDELNIVPPVDYKFADTDHLVIVGADEAVEKILHITSEHHAEDKFWKQGRKRM